LWLYPGGKFRKVMKPRWHGHQLTEGEYMVSVTFHVDSEYGNRINCILCQKCYLCQKYPSLREEL